MKLLENKQRVFGNDAKYESMIGASLEELRSDPIRNQKKIVELCHVGKFLMLLGEQNTIALLSEVPDFIVNVNGEQIGLEHKIVIDPKSKEHEGFIENVFSIAEAELAIEEGLPNFFVNCYLFQDLSFRLSDKPRLISEVKSVVREYVNAKALLPNSIIERITMMRHSGKNIHPNFGAWWQRTLTIEILMSAISRKEKKVHAYERNTKLTQWLLLVVGGTNGSSYEVNENLQFEVVSQFHRIYLLEDLSERLFVVK